jgi:quinoprotein glucose dehydrogenase
MRQRMWWAGAWFLLGWTTFIQPAFAQHGEPQQYDPKVKPASAEPLEAMSRLKLPKGFQVSLFAAEPMLANPVTFALDEKNRVYVIETYRVNAGAEDNRGHMTWLDDDLASRTVADRIAMYKKHLGANTKRLEAEHDRIRLIEDVDGDGKADKSTVFADGFNHMEDGIAAGLLARGGKLWFANVPNLWTLRDSKGTGQADERKVLHTGYGVHVSFVGHDLHGLKMGPDGRLYFSVGDRGAHIETAGKTVSVPDTGAVFRCNLDGSDLEIFATGLRNPQELAFDDFGNLFTGDNNSDSGDKARWVYVVEGGDSGWQIGYQYIEYPNSRGPFNAEKLWYPHFPEQAAYIVPPIANIADGPAGLVHYPGTGFGDRYKGHFFLCDFRGAANISGIHSFANKPKGAGFELVDHEKFVWNTLATDVDFTSDGAMYILDWVEGWAGPRKGRIFKVTDPEELKDPAVLSTKKLLAEGFAQRSSEELAKLLEHADQRVRLGAQFALAEKGSNVIPLLKQTALEQKSRLASIHSIWALGQIGRKDPKAYRAVEDIFLFLRGNESEILAQIIKVLGEAKVKNVGFLIGLLTDPSPRVQYFVAMALRGSRQPRVVNAIVDFIKRNDDKDPFLRHAGVMVLASPAFTLDELGMAAKDDSPAVRKAVAVAMRRRKAAAVARFLHDKDPLIVLEAARAINDVPIPAAQPALADLIKQPIDSLPLGYRVLNANFREGNPSNAQAVAEFAARDEAPPELRIEAVRELTDWDKPGGRDRVMGLWRPLPARPGIAAKALAGHTAPLFNGPDGLLQDAAKCVAKLGLKGAGPLLFTLLADKLDAAMKLAVTDANPRLRADGRRVLAKLNPAEALAQFEKVLESGKTAERQGALLVLGEWNNKDADPLLDRWLDKLGEKKAPLDIQLELIEAAAKRSSPDVKAKLKKFEGARAKAPLLERFREALEGGDAEVGQQLFLSKAEASCLRCHKAKGEGGDVGPDLSKIGATKTREYLLESILDPNKELAQGYETAVIFLSNGQMYTGVVKSETATELKLQAVDGSLKTIRKNIIEERLRGKSAMPEDVAKSLTKAELRDLVEFLAQLK